MTPKLEILTLQRRVKLFASRILLTWDLHASEMTSRPNNLEHLISDRKSHTFTEQKHRHAQGKFTASCRVQAPRNKFDVCMLSLVASAVDEAEALSVM